MKSFPHNSLLGFALNGNRISMAVVRRANAHVRIDWSRTAHLSLDILKDESELVGKEIRDHLDKAGVKVEMIKKIAEGSPHVLDLIRKSGIDLIINTPNGKGPMLDEGKIRSIATGFGIPIITTIPGAGACISGMESLKTEEFGVRSLQEYHSDLAINKSNSVKQTHR